jgi:hypothetical protein
MRWFGFEQRWRDELCRAAIPETDSSDLPAWSDLDADELWARFAAIAPPALQRSWRVTVWVTTLRPLLRLGRPHRFGRLSPDEQQARLDAMGEHPSYAMRQLASLLRLVVCVGYLGNEGVRARVTDWASS